jgi:uncharacterized protein (TIGR02118 family)
MVRISILYPNNKSSRFDLDYYIDKYMPLAIKLLSVHPGFKGVSVERGIGGATPGSEAAYFVMCHYSFDSVENYMAAFAPHAAALQGDIPNYTDVAPVIQFNEILMAR